MFAKYIDIKQSVRLILFHLCKRIFKKVYFDEILTEYIPRDEDVPRTNFRAASENSNAVVVIITRFNTIFNRELTGEWTKRHSAY